MDQEQHDEPAGLDPDEAREAYIARWGGHWGDSVSGAGVWISATGSAPVPGPGRERGRGGV